MTRVEECFPPRAALAEMRLHGQTARSPLENVRGISGSSRRSPRSLEANRVEVEQTVAELKVRLGERARKLTGPTVN